MNPNADFYFSETKKWHKELIILREIVLDCGLQEELKWGVPCYTLSDSTDKKKPNIVLIHVFKEYCALLFFKGVLMKDTKGILIQQTENVQSARQLRFTNLNDIIQMKATVKAYIHEAIAIEKAGLTVELKKTSENMVPEELSDKFEGKAGAKLKAAFEALTPGRQRAYLFYFNSAKQAKTRIARIEKYTPNILNGKGLDD